MATGAIDVDDGDVELSRLATHVRLCAGYNLVVRDVCGELLR